MDAQYCEKCGTKLSQKSGYNSSFNQQQENKGMSTRTKVLIVAIIVIVGVLGVTAGILMQANKINTVTNNSQVTVSESPEQVTHKADWHEIGAFTGSGTKNDFANFQTKGDQFKVVMSAKPVLNYNANSLDVDVGTNHGNVGHDRLEWGPNDSVTVKEKTITITAPSGSYSLDIYSFNLENWTIKVYDYY